MCCSWARFRVRHEHALSEVFVEVLRLCQEAGVLAVGVVALDGTKIQADASLGANRSYGFIGEQVEAMLSEAADADAQEDAEHGEARSDELPAELAERDSRLRKLEAREGAARGRARRRARHSTAPASSGEPRSGRRSHLEGDYKGATPRRRRPRSPPTPRPT